MLKDIRAQLLMLGVSSEVLEQYESAVRAELVDIFTPDAGFDVDTGHWRLRCMQQAEKAQRFELLLAVKENRIREFEEKTTAQSIHIAELQKQIFGDKSERQESSSESKMDAALPAAAATASTSKKLKRGKQPGTPGHGRKFHDSLPPPVQVHHKILPELCSCPFCGLPRVDLPPVRSKEIHRKTEIIVREHVRQKARRTCQCANFPPIVTANAPPKLIKASKFSTEFWMHIIEEKFLLQRPLARTIIQLGFDGLSVSAGTLTNGMNLIYESQIYQVIYQSIIDRSRAASQWRTDETGWKVFSASEKGKSPRWYMWVFSSEQTCVFVLDPRRSNLVVAKHLKGVTQGIVVCDRFSAYKAFGNRHDGFLIAFCWIHQRRDFIKLRDGDAVSADWATGWINRIDALMKQNDVRVSCMDDQERFEGEDEILRQMIQQMETLYKKELKRKNFPEQQKSRLISLKEHWAGLTVFVDHPLVPMTNNEAERALRNLVVGRKNYYGSRSEWSGELNAMLATIYATLEKNGVDARKWMHAYSTACANNGGDPPANLHPFLPWNFPKSTLPRSDDPPLTISMLPEFARELVTTSSKPPPIG